MKKASLTFCLFIMSMLVAHNAFGQNQAAVQARSTGYQLQKAGDYTAALKELKKATRLDPYYAAPHNDLGILYEELGNAKNAEQAYLKALSIDPTYVSVYTNLAALYETQGDITNALRYWKMRSKMGNTDDPWRKKAMQKINMLSRLETTYDTNDAYGTSDADAPASAPRRVMVSARKDIRDHQFQDAIAKLENAKTQGGNNVEKINELLSEARERAIDADIAKAAMSVSLYKQTKMLEVEQAWYPPTAEPNTGRRTHTQDTQEIKSAARLILEKKAHEIIPSIDFTDAQLKDVVEYLALSNDINIVIDEEVIDSVSGVSIHLKTIPLIEALDIILRTKGLKYRFEDNIIWVTTAEKLAEEDLVVKVYDVQDLIGKIHDFPSMPFDINEKLKNTDVEYDNA